MMYLKHCFVICLCSLNWSCLDAESSDKISLVKKSALMGNLQTCISSGEPVSLDVVLLLILFMHFLESYCEIRITSATFKIHFSPYMPEDSRLKLRPIPDPISSLESGLSLDRRFSPS